MRDNLPNYLNMHNIDPGRIEPACIDTPPGNDSIRPGQSKVVKMTREEAANILDLKTRPEALADFVGPELAGIVHQAMIMGAEALRGPQPDPITGLVPCGCGGVAEQMDFHAAFFPHSKVECLECGIEIMRTGYTIAEAHDMAKMGWNTSRGYTAPHLPGATEEEK